jgi:type I restriction enzyme M protein
MPRGTLTSSQGGDDVIRKAMLDDDLIECIIDLPGQLFFNVQIPSCLWFLNKDKTKWKNDRSGQVLFIDARKLGTPISRTQIEFSDEEIARIANTFIAWSNGDYEDVNGFCASVSREDIAKNGGSLSPGRFIGTEIDESESDEEFEQKITRLTSRLSEQFTASQEIELEIRMSLIKLGFPL